MTIVTQIFIIASLKSWHRELDHLSYINLKYFSNIKRIDISKIKMDKDIFFCKICNKTK